MGVMPNSQRDGRQERVQPAQRADRLLRLVQEPLCDAKAKAAAPVKFNARCWEEAGNFNSPAPSNS